MVLEKYKRRPQESLSFCCYTVPVGTDIASGTSTVSTWYTTTVNYLDLSWQTATLEVSDRPAGTIFYLTNGYGFNTLDPNLNYPDAPEATSGSIVISMQFQAYWGRTTRAFFTYGTLERIGKSSALSTATDVSLPTTSRTSSQSVDTATVGNSNDNDSDPGLSSGAIAGIAIGGVLALALIIGGWYFWQRRKRARTAPSTPVEDKLVEKDGDGNILELDTKEALQEMPGRDQVDARELDPTQYSRYAPNGSHELMGGREGHHFGSSHELDDGSRPRDILVGETERMPPVRVNHQDLEDAVVTTKVTAAASSNVEAQRRREMEWLEMEEERMRKRREMLAMQRRGDV